jgi:hypothetical protein
MAAIQEFNPAVDVLPNERKLVRLICDIEEQGDTQKAKLMEAFLPFDRDLFDFLIPMIGKDAYNKTMKEAEESMRRERFEYISLYGELSI